MAYGKLAQQASERSGQYVSAGNREAWLSLFADDAVVQDPVGVSPLDPTGAGHKGKEAIAAFWDMVIAPGSIDFTIVSSHPAGDECANVVHMVNAMPGDMKIVVDMVVVYAANADGKLTSLKAYWDYDSVMSQLA
ncbi:nuclear transport factor 2 family protein [Spongiibacter tropicus]|uniref:nuclear transport factor 2 family protein n=1 Tax=Spongiibacter tropicus TaxID=454602 RepID=UPI0035BE3212